MSSAIFDPVRAIVSVLKCSDDCKNRVASRGSPAFLNFDQTVPKSNLHGPHGADQEEDFLRGALPNEVATTLSSVRTLSIRPFATTGKYAAGEVDLQQAGGDSLLEGLGSSDESRVTLSLRGQPVYHGAIFETQEEPD